MRRKDINQPFWIWPATLGVVGLIALVIWALNRIFPSKSPHTAVGNALMRVDAILQPSREHMIEAREWEESQEDAGADPPTRGNESKG